MPLSIVNSWWNTLANVLTKENILFPAISVSSQFFARIFFSPSMVVACVLNFGWAYKACWYCARLNFGVCHRGHCFHFKRIPFRFSFIFLWVLDCLCCVLFIALYLLVFIGLERENAKKLNLLIYFSKNESTVIWWSDAGLVVINDWAFEHNSTEFIISSANLTICKSSIRFSQSAAFGEYMQITTFTNCDISSKPWAGNSTFKFVFHKHFQF